MSRPDPADESKIIDLRQLGALIDPKAPVRPSPRAAESAVALPTFGADRLRAPVRPLVAPPPPPVRVPIAPPAVTPARSDSTLLMVMICGLTLVVLGLTVFVVLTPPTTIVERVPTVAMQPAVPSVKEADRALLVAAEDGRDEEPDAAAVPAEATEDEAAEGKAADEAAADEADASEANDEPAAKADRRRRSAHHQRTRESKPADDTPPRETKPSKSEAKPKPTKANTADLPAECIIDPASCGLGKSKPAPTPKPETKPAQDLPDKLTAAQLRRGIAKVKSKAKACASKHGGKSGDKIEIKLTIQGSSGRVTNAAPVAPYAGTPLGGCVAGALKGATFDRFGATVQGVQYGIRL